jgi:hypothetical protein
MAQSRRKPRVSVVRTLVLADIASGWTERVAPLVRESTLVADAIDRLRTTRCGFRWSTTIILAGRVASSADATRDASRGAHRSATPAFHEVRSGREGARIPMERAEMTDTDRVAVAG